MSAHKILVTGATGFVGQELITQLSKARHQIYTLSKSPLDQTVSKNIKEHFIQDITKPFKLNVAFDYVYHLAACNFTNINVPQKDMFHKVNVEGTKHVINSCQSKHFIFLSTAKVYRQAGRDIDESSMISPQAGYAQSKWEAEEICRRMIDSKRLTIFRSVNIIGATQPPKAVIPVFIQKARLNEDIEILGGEGAILQAVSVKDTADLFQKILDVGDPHGIFNVTAKNSMLLKDLAALIVKHLKSSSKIIVRKSDEQEYPEVKSKCIRSAFGWQPHYTIEDIVKDMLHAA